jgi:hypothetical protein
MFQTKVTKKITTHFVFIDCIPNIVPFVSYVHIYGGARHATDNDIFMCRKYEICMLDKCCYRHTLRICNIYRFSTAAVVTRMYVSALSLNLKLIFARTGLLSLSEKKNRAGILL